MGQHTTSKTPFRSRDLDEAAFLTAQHVIDSTQMVKREEEQLPNSCESAKVICDSQDAVDEIPDTSSMSLGEIQETQTKANVNTDNGGEEALRRPDSLKGIQSFQRSHSDFASLGLAFPTQNSSMAVARWPNITERTALNDDIENYTYSPGYDQAHSKASNR